MKRQINGFSLAILVVGITLVAKVAWAYGARS
jgi:hypothetical protein